MANKVKGNPHTERFFESNPELRAVREFQALITRVGEDDADKIMWAIHLVEDTESLLYNASIDERQSNVQQTYLKKEEFNWKDYDDVVVAYRRYTMGPKQRMYAEYMDLMEERSRFLRTLSYSEDTTIKEAKEIDNFVKSGKSVWDELIKIEKEYLTEKDAGSRIHGDRELSAIESGII